MLTLLDGALIVAAALCMIVPAVRHPEWRGGLLALGCVFLAAAADEAEALWERVLPPLGGEPELLPILLALALGVAAALRYRRSTLAGLRAVLRNRRLPILVWGLLLVSVLPNLAGSKALWGRLAPGAEASHAVREAVSGAVALLGHVLLLNWAVLFLRDKRRVLARRPSPHAHLLDAEELVQVGAGTRRVCYRLGGTGFCAKFYKPRALWIESGKHRTKDSIRREIGWKRFDRYHNSSSLEVHYYNLFRRALPPALAARLPAVCERVFHPDYGWGVLETYYTNPDGTAIIPYEFEFMRRDAATNERIYAEARAVLAELVRAGAPFYEPGNLHVLFRADGSFELKIVDFEPTAKTAVPLEAVWPAFRRRKLRRKAVRYLAEMRRVYGIRGSVAERGEGEGL